MRVFAISDLHVDYDENDQWVAGLSTADYVDDLLILAGDVSDMPQRLGRTLERLDQQPVQAQILAFAELLNANCHPFVAIFRLVAVGAEEAIPDGEAEAVVAVGLDRLR